MGGFECNFRYLHVLVSLLVPFSLFCIVLSPKFLAVNSTITLLVDLKHLVGDEGSMFVCVCLQFSFFFLHSPEMWELSTLFVNFLAVCQADWELAYGFICCMPSFYHDIAELTPNHKTKTYCQLAWWLLVENPRHRERTGLLI